MATAIALEQLTQRARDHRDHGDIPQAEWHDMTQAAEAAFALDHRAIGGNDPAARAAGNMLDRDQMAAMGLARAMAVSGASDRENPFQRAELRQAFERERAYARTLPDRFERAPEHDRETRELRHTAVGHNPNSRELHGEKRVSNAEWSRAVIDAELAIEARHMSDPKAADPVVGMGMKIPAGLQAQAYEVADQLAHSEDVAAHQKRDVAYAEPGQRYSGKVLDVTREHVFQQVGERTIAHDRTALTGRLMTSGDELRGRSVEIHYPVGRVGLVRDAGKGTELSGAQKDISKDYGREK
ncbi:MAG: hypothetical protein PHT60_15355 [Acidiphilium sp.]|nr:hypothetical protein [Acidiphilium sp.]MDD4937139.1 hypothetical protein [Acidiphilium sp.]